MVKKSKNKVSKPNNTADTTKSDQLELTKTTKNSSELDVDDESININQIEPKKKSTKIDCNTLATSYFSASSKSGNESKNKKVLLFKEMFVMVPYHLLTAY
jgi:hypothetical protein